MGFQSRSFYVAIGSYFDGLLRAHNITELDRDHAETNPSNQPNQPSATCGALVSASIPRGGKVSVPGKRTRWGGVSRDSSVIYGWDEIKKRIAVWGQ